MITKQDVLEAIGKHRVRQVSIETELVLSGKVPQHPTEIGIGENDRRTLSELLIDLEAEGLIRVYGDQRKTYEVVPHHVPPTVGADIKAVMDAAEEDLKELTGLADSE